MLFKGIKQFTDKYAAKRSKRCLSSAPYINRQIKQYKQIFEQKVTAQNY